MDNSKQQNQMRFLYAAVLSMAVLFIWSYIFAPQKPQTDNANTAQIVNTTNTPAPEAQPIQQPQTTELTPDTAPNRQITIKSPLYEVTLDSKGALATSWILLKDDSPKGERPLFADGSTENDKIPLQMISQEALNRNPREIPFRLSTADQALNTTLNNRNYQVSAAEETITLAEGQERQIDFTLTDASGVEVTKSFLFRADSYVAD